MCDTPESSKPLLEGLTAVTRIPDDHMKAEESKNLLPTSEAVMKILPHSTPLLYV